MYSAYIGRIKNLRLAPNSDKLWLGEVFEETVIVAKNEFEENQLVLYMPEGGQVLRWFGDKFNLFRYNIDGSAQGGLLENNGHIKAITLRGNKSFGICLPLKEVCKKFNLHESDYKEGDKITQLFYKGESTAFIQKFLPSVTQKNKKNMIAPKKSEWKEFFKKKTEYPTFYKHLDTEQLAFNYDKFEAGDMLDVSIKLHGCFAVHTKVRMADGTLKEIQKIKAGEEVLGYNFKTNKFESTKVLNTFKNAPSSNWNKIKISREGLRGDRRGSITSTDNHKYWVENKKEWVMAKNLKVGEEILIACSSPILTSVQKQVIIGQLLGDGCLFTFNDRLAEIQESKKEEHKEYLEYLNKITSGLFYLSKSKRISEYGTIMVKGRTSRSVGLYNYMKKNTTFSHEKDAQRLKENIVNEVSPLSLAIWYMGDGGSLAHSEYQEDRANIAICRYTQKEDRVILEKILNKFNIIPSFYQDTGGYWRIRLNRDEAVKFFDLIAPYIPPIMQYKLPLDHKKKFKMIEDPEKFVTNGWEFISQTVLENTPLNKKMDEYDIETELHNYIVGNCIVHNSSARFTYARKREKSWLRKLLHMKPKISYDYAVGSRNCIVPTKTISKSQIPFVIPLNENCTKDEAMRINWLNVLIPKLSPGMEVYGEIVGFVDGTNTTIMPSCHTDRLPLELKEKLPNPISFTYNCAAGESKLFIYRITSDNGTTEWSPTEIEEWCAKNNLTAVPHLEIIAFKSKEQLKKEVDLLLKDILIDPLTKTSISEGIVLRKMNPNNKWEAYKQKTFEFKLISGIITEKAFENISQDTQEEI